MEVTTTLEKTARPTEERILKLVWEHGMDGYAATAVAEDDRLYQLFEPAVQVSQGADAYVVGLDSQVVQGRRYREQISDRIEYQIDGLIARGGITTWGGYSGAGKTPTELMKIDALLSGRPNFLGYKVNPLPDGFHVIYLTEESKFLFATKIEAAGMTVRALERMDIAYWDANYGIPWEQMVQEQVWRLNGCGLLVVDTALWWSGILGENTENDSTKMSELYRPLVRAAGEGLAVDVLAHCNKLVLSLRQDSDMHLGHIRGSSAVVASSWLVMGVKKPHSRRLQADQRFITALRDKITGREEAMYTRLGPEGLERIGWQSLGDDHTEPDDETRVLEAIKVILEAHEAPTGAAIASVAGMRKAKTLQVLASLQAEGKISHPGNDKEGWTIR